MDAAQVPLLCRVLGSADYEELKRQLAALRAEATASQATLKFESQAVLTVRGESAAREAELRAQLDKATANLRDQLEKAARARRMHERRVVREKKALQAKADELTALLEQQHQRQLEELEAAAAQHAAALKAARREAADARSVLDNQLSRLSAEASEHEGQLQQQRASELAAARQEAALQVAALQDAIAALRSRCTQLEKQARQAADAGSRERAQAAEWRARASEQQARAEVAEQAAQEQGAAADEARRDAEGLRGQLESARLNAAAHAAAQRNKSEGELAAVQERFMALLQRKDSTIAALRQQLQLLDAAL
eukprot:scaffold3.g6520.t1